jgi:AbrB family transcriptional regulator (stage V sporulation protein T)
MKALGIVRRVDDLGRVVIPKELRRTLRIRENDPLEIFTTETGEIIFRKYSPVADQLENEGEELAKVLWRVADVGVIITDADKIVARYGNLARRVTRGTPPLGPAVSQVLGNPQYITEWARVDVEDESQHLVDIHEGDYGDYPKVGSQYIAPIMCDGTVVGTVIILSDNQELLSDQKAQADIVAEILSSKLA